LVRTRGQSQREEWEDTPARGGPRSVGICCRTISMRDALLQRSDLWLQVEPLGGASSTSGEVRFLLPRYQSAERTRGVQGSARGVNRKGRNGKIRRREVDRDLLAFVGSDLWLQVEPLGGASSTSGEVRFLLPRYQSAGRLKGRYRPDLPQFQRPGQARNAVA
jgi:hypothetical protein